MRQPRRTHSFPFLKKGKEKEEGAETWTKLVARSLLFRVHPKFRPAGVQSGSAICILEELSDGAEVAKIAGFTSFAQESSAIQNFDIEGDRLYTKMEQGRVAFFGAFQLPSKLTDEHMIM